MDETHPFPQSAPGHLAAIAHLFGLEVPDVSTARVLEIGCSAGGNLIPFAAWHPEARAVGIDLSQVQIDQGRRRVAALGLRNVELFQADIAQIDPAALGTFDLVVCHGVYSRVPEHVQQAILSAFRAALAPDGIGYHSYNVYPCWKAREIVRDAMLLRGGAMTSPQEKVSYARGMIDFLEEVAPADSVLAKALSDYRAQGNLTDHYLHEDMKSWRRSTRPATSSRWWGELRPTALQYLIVHGLARYPTRWCCRRRPPRGLTSRRGDWPSSCGRTPNRASTTRGTNRCRCRRRIAIYSRCSTAATIGRH
jgi:SAM-dependent methyltransferase